MMEALVMMSDDDDVALDILNMYVDYFGTCILTLSVDIILKLIF